MCILYLSSEWLRFPFHVINIVTVVTIVSTFISINIILYRQPYTHSHTHSLFLSLYVVYKLKWHITLIGHKQIQIDSALTTNKVNSVLKHLMSSLSLFCRESREYALCGFYFSSFYTHFFDSQFQQFFNFLLTCSFFSLCLFSFLKCRQSNWNRQHYVAVDTSWLRGGWSIGISRLARSR